jgi:hypothetical protein
MRCLRAACLLGLIVSAGCEALLRFDPILPPDGPPDAPPGDAPVCGNNYVEGTEECDDGVNLETGSCPMCRFAQCGDGLVHAGVEECDPADAATPTCTSACLACNEGDLAYARETNQHCYLSFAATAVYNDARDACFARRTHLVTLTDITENADVNGAIVPTAATWMGLEDRTVEGTFVWISGEPFGAFTNWSAGNPDNGGVTPPANCGAVSTTGMWDDTSCTATLGYVCEQSPWRVRPEDGHAYRVIPGLFMWSEAVTECGAVGGHLATINSAEEQLFLAGATGGAIEGQAWIGATDAVTEGTFAWVIDEPFDAYTNWNTGQPDDALALEDCVMMLADPAGSWADVDCTSRRGALCEVP